MAIWRANISDTGRHCFNLAERLGQDSKTAIDPLRNFGPTCDPATEPTVAAISIGNLKREGFRHIFEFSTRKRVQDVPSSAQQIWNHLKA